MTTQRTAEDLQSQMIYDDVHVHGLSPKEVGTKYGLSRWAVARRLQKLKSFVPTTPVAQAASSLPIRKGVPVIPESVDEAMDIWNEYIVSSGSVPKAPKYTNKTGERKIVLANDIHAPFHDEKAVAALINENAHDTDLLIIGGDLLDLFAVSRYEKYSQHFSLAEEFRSGKALINLLASKFNKIKLISGNHDERWKKHLVTRRGMKPGEIEAINLLGRMATGDEEFDLTDPLWCLVRDLPNVELVRPVRKDYATFGFFCQEGDLIVSHAEKFSRLTGQTAAAAAQWFKSCAIPSGLCKDFRVFAQTHNHQASWAWGNFGVWNIEAGCMCMTPDYAGNPKLMGAQRPPIVGYSVFYQDVNGRTDMRRSRFIPLEG